MVTQNILACFVCGTELPRLPGLVGIILSEIGTKPDN